MIMIRATGRALRLIVLSFICVVVLSPGHAFAGIASNRILKSFGRESGVFVVIGCGSRSAPGLAVDLGKNANSLVHAIAGDAGELAAFNKAIAAAGVKGYVTAEQLPLSKLPYRDYLVNVVVLMHSKKAAAEGLTLGEIRRCIAPYGQLVTCSGSMVMFWFSLKRTALW